METVITQAVVLSAIVVVLMQRIKPLWADTAKEKIITLYVPYFLGVVLAVMAKVGLLSAFGIDVLPWVDYVITGLLICGGSNVIYDLVAMIRGLKDKAKTDDNNA